MHQVFLNNLQALKQYNPVLTMELEKIQDLQRYEVYQNGTQATDLNIFDHANQQFIYQNPKLELTDQLNKLQVCKNHKYFYLFGAGNGFLLLSLLLNNSSKRICLFDPEIELIYIMLHLHDLSQYISKMTLQIWHTSQIDFSNASILMQEKDAINHSSYFSLISQSYYNRYSQDYTNLKNSFTQAIKFLCTTMGNNISDSIKGISQSIHNMSQLYSSPPLKQLYHLKKGKTAIIVSTGPSLNKQLSLLKKISAHVTLISVDASLPILYSHNIKPDIVVSMERDEPTSKFFINIPEKFQEDILFVCASLQHETVFKAIKKGTLMTVFRPMGEYRYFELDQYGYIGDGASAANMAHDLAFYMGISRTILIGQDLSFNEQGETHTKGHIFESNDLIEKERKDNNLLEIPAYGEKGYVKTHIYWIAFKQAFEYSIQNYHSQMLTINATEGGAHIQGSIELSFEHLCQELLQLPKKIPIHTIPPIEEEKSKVKIQIASKVKRVINEAEHFQKRFKNLNKRLEDYGSIQNIHKSINLYNDILELRQAINDNSSFSQFFLSVIIPAVFQDDLNIVAEDSKFYPDDMKRVHNVILANIPLWNKMLAYTNLVLDDLYTYE